MSEKKELTHKQMVDARIHALTVLDAEITRVFGSDGVRRLINNQIIYCKRKIDLYDGDVDNVNVSVYANQHDALIDYLSIIDEKALPF